MIPVCYITSDGNFTFTYTNGKWTGGADDEGEFTIKFDQQGRPTELDYTNGSVTTLVYEGSKVSSSTFILKNVLNETIKNKYNSSGQLTEQHYIFFQSQDTDSMLYVYNYPTSTSHNFTSINTTFYNSNHTGNPNIIIFPIVNRLTTYEYDNKINPYPNLHYANPLLATDNNITKASSTSDTNKTPFVITSTYTYNSKGYPLTETTISPNQYGNLVTTTTNFAYSNCQ